MTTLPELRNLMEQCGVVLTPWQWGVAERFLVTEPVQPAERTFWMAREQRLRHFLYSLAGQKTSGHLRAESNRASQYGDLSESWIAAIRVEASELLDSLYGEADPVTLARLGIPDKAEPEQPELPVIIPVGPSGVVTVPDGVTSATFVGSDDEAQPDKPARPKTQKKR